MLFIHSKPIPPHITIYIAELLLIHSKPSIYTTISSHTTVILFIWSKTNIYTVTPYLTIYTTDLMLLIQSKASIYTISLPYIHIHLIIETVNILQSE